MNGGSPLTRPRVVLAMDRSVRARLFRAEALDRLRTASEVDVDHVLTEFDTPAASEALAGVDVLLTGWGVPRVDGGVLDRAPRLRAIVHAAGTVRSFLDAGVLQRGIRVSTAADANAVPVAEFTVAAIVFGAKRAGRFAHEFRHGRWRDATAGRPWVGLNGITVGIVGASRVGRRVITLLRGFDVRVLVSDPYLTADEAAALGVELAELDDLVRRADVVSLHAPKLPATHELIDRRRLGLMPDDAVLINTARGSLVDTAALTDELVSGRIDAVLDVTDPEPLPADSPLYELPNVLLTPHIAGAMGNEIGRLGELAVDEVARIAAGRPLRYEIHAADLARIA